MKVTHVEHIGIAVRNLEDAIAWYENILGLKCYAVEEVSAQSVRTAFFMAGQTKIELLQSTAADGPIGKFIAKRGEGIHHLSYGVEGLEAALDEMQTKGVELIDARPKKGAEGLETAFLHPRSTFGVLTELCEKP